MTPDDFAGLKAAFDELAARRDAGPSGTMIIDSGHPGSTVGITVLTHGNEPAGLAAWRSLTRDGALRLIKGRIIFVLNNLKAAESYFALPLDAPFEEKQKTRIFERNMNRLPRDLRDHDSAEAYEIARALELLPVWRLFDIGFDIHTTSQAAPPMLCVEGATDAALYRGMPIKDVIVGFDAVARDAVVTGFLGEPGSAAQSFSMEAGEHEDTASWRMAETAIRILLGNLGMAEPAGGATPARRVYHLTGSLFFPDAEYRTTEIFPNFAPMISGQVLATGPGPDLIAPHDGHVLMCPKSGQLADIREEAVFLSAPMQEMAAG